MRWVALLALAGCAHVQESIAPERLQRHLAYIAGDELEGRLAGERGNDLATEYIAKAYARAGLKPIGDNGTFFQRFTVGRRGRTATTRNTIGLLEGTDLKDQYIVIGAHHDHVGRRGMRDVGQLGGVKDGDDIWNGADDNGSGTCCVITLAESIGGRRPRRSIVFMTWSAEEWGLLGSKYYCDHPIVPLEKTVAYFNMDMMGRGSLDKDSSVSGLLTAKERYFKPIVERAASATGLRLVTGDHYGPGSDHESFAAKKIPVLSWCENGPCPDYHCVTDHADKINYEYMAKLLQTVRHALLETADRDDAPQWNPAYQSPAPSNAEKPRLGVGAESLSPSELHELGLENQGAVAITAITPGSMGEQIGLKEDDILVRIGGKPLPKEDARAGLRAIMDSLERGVEYEIEFYRGRDLCRVRAVWPKNP